MKADVDQKAGRPVGEETDRIGGTAGESGASIVRSRLFIKYVALFVSVVVLALVANGAFEVWFSYQEQKASLINIQHQQAEAAADKSRSSSPRSKARLAGPRNCHGWVQRSISAASTRCGCCAKCQQSPSSRRSMRRATSS